MLVLNEHREKRARDLQRRLQKLGRIQADIIMSPEWNDPGVPESWMRAQDARTKLHHKLGVLASHWLMEDGA